MDSVCLDRKIPASKKTSARRIPRMRKVETRIQVISPASTWQSTEGATDAVDVMPKESRLQIKMTIV